MGNKKYDEKLCSLIKVEKTKLSIKINTAIYERFKRYCSLHEYSVGEGIETAMLFMAYFHRRLPKRREICDELRRRFEEEEK